jgi:hypothetical protein
VATPGTAPAPATQPSAEVKDQQTGKIFKKLPESWYDVAAAWLSALYSIAVILYLTFLVLALLSRKYSFWPDLVTNQIGDLLTGQVSKLILYTAIGGAMGAAVNNLRSFISWHAEERAFGWRFIWKYIAMPPLGGALAVLVYGILQGGMAVINGGATPEDNNLSSLSAWATGMLAGYGSSKVFIWLDDKVNSLFKIDKKQTAVPDVTGKTLDEAKQIVSSTDLEFGSVSEEVATGDQIGKVIKQTPLAGIQADCGSKVAVTIGKAAPAADTTVDSALKPANQNGNGNGTSPNGGSPGATEIAAGTNVATGTEASAENGTGAAENGTGAAATTVAENTAGTEETTETTASAETTASEETAETGEATEEVVNEAAAEQPAGEVNN